MGRTAPVNRGVLGPGIGVCLLWAAGVTASERASEGEGEGEGEGRGGEREREREGGREGVGG